VDLLSKRLSAAAGVVVPAALRAADLAEAAQNIHHYILLPFYNVTEAKNKQADKNSPK
jgi:hypothetical protein